MSGRYRYVIAGMLFAAAIVNYVDRSSIGIVAPLISREFHFSASEMGAIFSSFFIGYSLFGVVGGYLADRFGTLRVYAVTMTAWSLACGATILASNFVSLLVLRFVFGLGEGPQTPLTVKTVRAWFPREEAGLVVGTVLNTGNMLGAAIAGPLVGLLAVGYGWRAAFVLITALGLLWVVPWLAYAADTPAQSRRISPQERDVIARSQATAGKPAGGTKLSGYFLSPVVLAIAGAFFASQYVNYLLLSWLPTYLNSVRHLDLTSMSLVTAIPWILGAVGAIVGGGFSDWLFRRSGNALWCRKLVGIVALLVSAACMACADQVTSVGMAVAVLGLGNFTLHMVPGACWMLISETVPSAQVGSVTGYASTIGTLSGAVSPLLNGIIISHGGSYALSFGVAAAIAVLGAVALLVCVGSGGSGERGWQRATVRP
jgi:ACS family hexuronate transporter-like MFS transporter